MRLGEEAPLWQPSEGYTQGPEGLKETPASKPTLKLTPYQFPDPAKIPPRQWLYGRHYIRGMVSGTLGQPGRLKSTTSLTELIGMSVGLDLLNGKKPLESGPLPVV